MMFCHKENKETVQEFSDVFEFFQRCIIPDPKENPLFAEGLKPLELNIACVTWPWNGRPLAREVGTGSR
jgi:hypothetical protein